MEREGAGWSVRVQGGAKSDDIIASSILEVKQKAYLEVQEESPSSSVNIDKVTKYAIGELVTMNHTGNHHRNHYINVGSNIYGNFSAAK